LRGRIVAMAAREALAVTRPRRRAITQHGSSDQQLSVFLKLVTDSLNFGACRRLHIS
jgi:tRNA G18 (ribose-2'-O)-methylase SpoU